MPSKVTTPAPAPASKAKAAVQPKLTPAVSKRELSANNYMAVVAVVTLIVVVVCGLIGKSLVGQIVTNSKLLLKKNQARSALDTKLSNIPTLVSNYQALGSKKDLISHALPTSADFPQLVSITQGIASNAGVQLKSLTPAAPAVASTSTGATTTPAATSGAQEYTYSAEVSGSYTQIVQFYKNVELSARPIKVVSSDFSGADGSVRATVILATYYQEKAKIDDTTETLK